MVTRFSDVHTPWLDTADTPQIKLQGAYLERMGFHVGMNIKIEVEKGRIVITPMEDIEEGEAVWSVDIAGSMGIMPITSVSLFGWLVYSKVRIDL